MSKPWEQYAAESGPWVKFAQQQTEAERQAKIKAQREADLKEFYPTKGMSGTEKFLAGFGKGFVDIGRGVGQLVGAVSQEEIDQAKQLDAPLMNTGAGLAGNIAGNVAALVPTALIPGAATVRGAALLGGATGALQPVATGESRLKNTAIGAGAGALGPVLVRSGSAAWKGSKALAEPFTEAGRQKIAGRTLERFGVRPQDVSGVTNAPTATGARLSLAEQIADPTAAAGAARLQDAVRSLDPEIASRMAAREVENNAARVGVLESLAGRSGARDAAEASRQLKAKEFYTKAFSTVVNPEQLAPEVAQEFTALSNVPAIRDALKSAETIAANQGIDIGNPQSTIQGMHLMKLAMDDAIEAAGKGGSAQAVNKAKSIGMAKDRLVALMETLSDDYKTARQTYAQMSRPINQADIAEEVLTRGSSATSDLAGNQRLMPDKLMRAMGDEQALVRRATGGRASGDLASVLEPQQLQSLRDVAGETNRAAAVARAGQGPGSATAQRLASQNIIRQIGGPLGLPESWAESTLLQTMMRPVQFAYSGVAEPKLQQTLAELVLNPESARAALAATTPAQQRLPLSKFLALPSVQQAARASLPSAAVAGER